MSGIEGLKKKAIGKLPKLATRLRKGMVAMDVAWGIKTPSELDIVTTLTCLINDLDPDKDILRVETGSLYAEYDHRDEVKKIDFGLVVGDYVMKV